MKISDFDYELPAELIAQRPAEKRDVCRLMVMNRAKGSIEHKHFYDILDYLNKGDCLILNNSKVLPARLFGEKEGTGARVEFLLIKRIEGDRWETMVRPGKRLKPGDAVSFGKSFRAEIVDYGPDGTRIVDFKYEGIFMERLDELGKMPLPPYIERESTPEDKDMYQTVYCKEEGSVAAPTAGLHFTDELLKKAEEKGVKLAYVTLHVGIGTFRPVKCENVEDHSMHFEEYFIDEENAALINDTIREGGRIISVGTTSTRTVESAAYFDEELGRYQVAEGSGSTDIFIYPGYKFKIIEALITNFHLPKSTLLMLISALYDREKILEAYEIAVREKYRFFSYGDACLII
ncbi:MAG: tRNA preQ1(34) S-adenosylmethionine ribosyltransferase-isomerase QueA [Emergencia sp.]